MADLERIKKKYDTPEIDIEEATNGGNRYSLPYGLCKSVGINTEGMTPREAWEAWQNKTGKTKAEAEKEHWGKTADEKQPQNENSKENTSENVIKRKEDIKTKDDLISYIKHRHGVELKNENIPFLNDKKNRLYTEIPQENRNSILNDLRQQGFSVEEHNKGYYWIDLPEEEKQTDKKQEASTPNNEKDEQAKETKNLERAYSSTRKGVSEDLARRAKESRSFSEYKSGSATASYNSDVSRFDSNVNELIQRYGKNSTLTDKDWEDVYSIADRYAPNLEKYTDETNRNEASYPSWFIAGPARYNAKKNEALMNRSQALYENYKDRIDPDDNLYLKKIKAILTNASIKSNDDAATAKLQDKYDKLKAELENGKAMNAYFRKNKTLVGFPGISEQAAKEFDKANASGDYFSRQPFMPYRLQNGNAELHRIQARIDTLNKAKAQAEAAKANPQAAAESTAANYPKLDGVHVQENADEMRIQLRFDDIPPAETREKLKRNGFRWSPSQKAWQRLLNENGKYAAKSVLKDLGGK